MLADELPDDAYAVALAGLADMGPARLACVLDGRSARDTWLALRAGRPGDRLRRRAGAAADRLAETWQIEAGRVDPTEAWARLLAHGAQLHRRGRDLPDRLESDLEPPELLFVKGHLPANDEPTVAVVGTRRCTRYGIDVAHDLGRALSEAGVVVVSGLAKGIDAAAHAGVLSAGHAAPVAVVGSGLDVVYPAGNRALWNEVAARGAIVSEAPLGASPRRWRFPARNRIIAALADVTVVVESGRRGGSLSTVEEAADRGRPVMAVPGPIRSPASEGTNRLLRAGCAPVLDVEDVLFELGVGGASVGDHSPGPADPDRSSDEAGDPEGATGSAALVLDALGWETMTLGAIASRSGQRPDELAPAAAALVRQGVLVERGGYFERVSRV